MSNYRWDDSLHGEKPTMECVCPHCNLKIAGIKHIAIRWMDNPTYYVLECPSCSSPIIYQCYNQQTFPVGYALRSVKHLTEDVDTIYAEVRGAIAAGCYTAAVILARTAIMHIAVEQKAEENKSFLYYVNYLVEKGYVPPNAKAWIDTIRKMANDSVHKLEIWKKEDAEKIGTFLMYLLVFVYELPASVG